MLVAIEGLHRHEVGERVVVVVVLRDELRHHGHVRNARGVDAGEEWVVQNAARRALLHADTPVFIVIIRENEVDKK